MRNENIKPEIIYPIIIGYLMSFTEKDIAATTRNRIAKSFINEYITAHLSEASLGLKPV